MSIIDAVCGGGGVFSFLFPLVMLMLAEELAKHGTDYSTNQLTLGRLQSYHAVFLYFEHK